MDNKNNVLINTNVDETNASWDIGEALKKLLEFIFGHEEAKNIVENNNAENSTNEKNTIVEKNHNIDITDTSGWTALHLSILQNNPGITNHLIESGADVNAQTKYGDTPLATAVRTGNSEAVKLLLNNGANPNFKDSGNFTLLHNATNHNKLEILGLLLEAGANPNIQMRTFAYTPLHLACKNGDLKSVELLLKYGADPKIKDSDGRTALQLANNTITSKLIEDKIIVGSNQATRNPNTNQQQIQTTEVIQNNNINGDNPPAYSQRENNTVSIEDTLPPYSSLPPAYSLNDPRISKLNETKAEKPNCP